MLEIILYMVIGALAGMLFNMYWGYKASSDFFIRGIFFYTKTTATIQKNFILFPYLTGISCRSTVADNMFKELKNNNITWKTLKKLASNNPYHSVEAMTVAIHLQDVLQLNGVTMDYTNLLFKVNQGITIIVTTQEDYNNNFLKPLLNNEYDKLLNQPAKYITRMIKQAHLAGKLDIYNDIEEDNPIIITIAPTKEHWEAAHFATYTLDKKVIKPEDPQFQKEIKRILADDHSDLIEKLYTGQSILRNNLDHIGSLWI